MAGNGPASSSASTASSIGSRTGRSRTCNRDLLPLLNSGRVELLDSPRLVAQLCGLERRVARSGRDAIDHAPGAHDDLANAVAGAGRGRAGGGGAAARRRARAGAWGGAWGAGWGGTSAGAAAAIARFMALC